ncbi:TerB family tellurite resistance protein [Alsobacter sp. R-9]
MWGKIGGAGLGFAIGGPIGALLGAVAGHYVIDSESGLFGDDREAVFTTGLIALSAKMAKADGVVTRDEQVAFRQIVKVPPSEEIRIERLFALAKETSAGFEAYAQQIADRFGDSRELLEDVLDGLFHIAKADGAVHEAERRYLARVAAIFGFSESDYARIEARHVRIKDDPWVILGVERDWDDARLKAHWRRLVAENHPDRQIALGLPPEAIAIANARLSAINAAWDRIVKERGIR